jgi:hypothetical protein
MIIYAENGLANLKIQEQAEAACNKGLITERELDMITETYPTGFYSPNLFGRIGFFILTILGGSFAGSLLSLVLSATRVVEHAGWFLFLGLIAYAALELFTKRFHLYKSGIDNAMLWMAAALFLIAFMMAIDDHTQTDHSLIISIFVALLSAYFVLRFLSAGMSIISCLALLAVVFFAWKEFGAIGEATMPFVIMLVSYLIYYVSNYITRDAKFVYYESCLFFIKITSLLTLYLSGNYFVVQKLSNELHHLPMESNLPLPFGWFFWIWTILLPFGYIYLGVKYKSLMFLRIGMILVVAAIFTFRYFYHILSPEHALVLGGAVLLALTAALINYIKHPKLGFMYAKRSNRRDEENINLEGIIVAGASSHTTSTAANSATRFGGGNFGGGGSSGNF